MKYNIKQKHVRMLMICVILLVFSGCVGERKEHITLLDIRSMSIQDVYPLALEKALEWNNDVYLVHVRFKFQLRSDTKPLESIYTFQTRNDPTIWINIFIKESNSGYQIETNSGDFNVPRPQGFEIVPDNLPFDEYDAFQLALDYGGKDFFERSDTPDWPLLLQLRENNPWGSGQLIWSADLSDINLGNMHIFIDSETGEWLEIRDYQPVDGVLIKTPIK